MSGEYKKQAKVSGRTPYNTIRRYAQTDPRFTRIGWGVYALKSVQNAGGLPVAPPSQPVKEQRYAAMEGMLIEIGNNIPGVANTYTPDGKKVFQNKHLGSNRHTEKNARLHLSRGGKSRGSGGCSLV